MINPRTGKPFQRKPSLGDKSLTELERSEATSKRWKYPQFCVTFMVDYGPVSDGKGGKIIYSTEVLLTVRQLRALARWANFE